MKQTQLPRNLPLPRNQNPKLGNLGINILENLGKAMNIMKNDMNIKNRLGNHKGRINKSRISLELLGERQYSLRLLCMNKQGKPREKGRRRRRLNSLKSLLPRGKGSKKMTLLFTEMEPWSLLPPSLRQLTLLQQRAVHRSG